ncbi:MAG: hypothetical protein WDM94_07270 [Bauldia sp.]
MWNSESAVRRAADKAGYRVTKSRKRAGLDNAGEYMLVDVETNFAVLGSRYDADLIDIAEFLRT